MLWQVDQPAKETTSADDEKQGEESITVASDQSDSFEENFKEIKKWVDVKSSKYGMLVVVRERHCKRLGTALKVYILTSFELQIFKYLFFEHIVFKTIIIHHQLS